MCGIAAYVGKSHCREVVLEGLSRLEYRGYDSAGFVCIDVQHGRLSVLKAQGRLAQLVKKFEELPFDGVVGMGHTRWATHGVANEENAHPHFDCSKQIAVVHNGIIEDFAPLKAKLQKANHRFVSNTDTETVAHLLESLLTYHDSLEQSVCALVALLQGAFALTILLEQYPDRLVVIRRRCPLAVGIGEGEMFVGSDPLVFSDKTNKVLFLPDNSFAIVSSQAIDLYDFGGKPLPIETQKIDAQFIYSGKEGYEHFMLKEMYEQKRAIERTVRFYETIASSPEVLWSQLGMRADQARNVKTIHMVAAGTSWHAARIGQFFFETLCKIPVRVSLASEFRYMPFFPEQDALYMVISQSGETADTLEALRLIQSGGELLSIALTNVASSTMVREAQGFLLMQAGPEISVCSTKAFSAQLASLYWLAHIFAHEKGLITQEQTLDSVLDVCVTAEILEATIEEYKQSISTRLALHYSGFDRFIFLGRHISYPFAMEAALKLKEISYIFAQCYPSGELKHGPIALIDDKTPVVLFSVLDDELYHKLLANAQEVKARSGHLVVFAFEGQDELISLADCVFIIPRVKPLLGPLAMTGIMQFFVYSIAKVLGHPIDKPRNLAKSVTVE